MERAQEMDAYLFIVVESSVEKIIKENKIFNRRSNIDYTLRQIKDICHDYPRVCQFIFVENRQNASYIIPRLLLSGKNIWQTDMQYFWDTREQ